VRLVVGSPIDARWYTVFWADMSDDDARQGRGNLFVMSGPHDDEALQHTKRYRFDWKGQNDGARERIANPRGHTLAVPRRPQAVICPNKRRVITR